jgi:hypothetical protein
MANMSQQRSAGEQPPGLAGRQQDLSEGNRPPRPTFRLGEELMASDRAGDTGRLHELVHRTAFQQVEFNNARRRDLAAHVIGLVWPAHGDELERQEVGLLGPQLAQLAENHPAISSIINHDHRRLKHAQIVSKRADLGVARYEDRSVEFG